MRNLCFKFSFNSVEVFSFSFGFILQLCQLFLFFDEFILQLIDFIREFLALLLEIFDLFLKSWVLPIFKILDSILNLANLAFFCL